MRYFAVAIVAILILCIVGCNIVLGNNTPEPTFTSNAPEETHVAPQTPTPELNDPHLDGSLEVSYTRSIHLNNDTVDVFETAEADNVCLRIYQTGNEDCVTMGRVRNTVGQAASYIWTSELNGILRYYDREADLWIENDIAPCTVQISMIELLFEDGSSFLIYTPKTFRLHENGVMEYLPQCDGFINVEQNGDGWMFSLQSNIPDTNCVSDFTVVSGPRSMLNWGHPNCGDLWKNYTLETEGKWCFNGYFFPCAYNYVPTGENYLYNCPAAYFVKSMVYVAYAHPAAENLALAMLDTLAMEQNKAGYWPTSPRSEWLYEDYGVDKGFYDTRFNSDLLRIYRVYYDTYGGDVLRDVMNMYADFFVEFAECEHFLSPNGGWFIPDYTPASINKPHSSLNHQLAEIIELYGLADSLQRPDLEELAGKMLLAITDTDKQWINEMGDLHYCIFSDGKTFGRQDYPYLTYNDLFDLQEVLVKRYGAEAESIQFLMDMKKQWMDANEVTGYKK